MMDRFLRWLIFFFKFAYGAWLAYMALVASANAEIMEGWLIALLWYIMYNLVVLRAHKDLKEMIALVDLIDITLNKKHDIEKSSEGESKE